MHGLLFGLGRDADMDARNPYTSTTSVTGLNTASELGKTPIAMTNWGGDLGGPIKKGKLFYFVDFYRFVYNAGSQIVVNAPTTQSFATAGTPLGSPTNSIPDAIYGLINAGGTVSQLSLNMTGCGLEPGGAGYTPSSLAALVATANSSPNQIKCNYAGKASIFGNGTSSQAESLDFLSPGAMTSGIGKLDYHINEHNSFNLDYIQSIGYANAWGAKNSIQPYWTVDATEGAQIARAVWIWNINPTNLNEARVGFDRTNNNATNSDCIAEANGTAPNFQTAMGLYTGSQLPCAMPEATITGFTNLNIAAGPGPENLLNWTTSGIDNFSHTMGKHVLRAGIEIFVGGFHGTGNGSTGILENGTLTFTNNPAPAHSTTPLEDFMTGVPSSGTVQYGDVKRNPQMNYYAAYFEDDYRVSSRISATLGLRYEYYTPYEDKAGNGDPLGNQFGSVCLTCISGMMQETSNTQVYQQKEANNFGPHLGISYDVTGKGTTVVRASFDILYATQSYSALSSMAQVPTAATLVEAGGNLGPACCGSNTSTVPTGTINNTVLTATYPAIPWTCGPAVSAVCPAGQIGATVYGGLSTSLYCGNAQLETNANPLAPAGVVNPALCAPTQIIPNLRVPYVPEWEAELGHSFGKSVTFSAAYVGNHGVKLRSSYDMNQPTLGPTVPSTAVTDSGTMATATINDRRPLTYECPVTGPTGVGSVQGLLPAGVTQGSGPYGSNCFPYFGVVNQIGNADESIYNALELSMAMRAYHGLTFNMSYTWSHWLSGESFFGGETASLQTPGQDYYDPKLDIGNVGFPQHFTVTLNYRLPGRKAPGQMLQGWAINSGLLINGSLPISPTDTSDNLAGTGEGSQRWTMASYVPASGAIKFNSHSGSAFTFGENAGPPCYGISGSAFAKAGTGCAIINPGTTATLSAATAAAYVSDMPAACVAASEAEQASPSNVPASEGGGYTGGLYELAKIGCYMQNNTVMIPPAQGTYGLMEAGTLFGDPFRQFDLALTKTWVLKERYNITFRADCFNCINIVNYSGAGTSLNTPGTFGIATKTPNSGGAGTVIGNGSPREAQLGIRLTF